MTTTQTTYSGKARVLDRNGFLLDVGRADLSVTDPQVGAWRGTITVFAGSCLQHKSLTALLEMEDGRKALAQLGPTAGRPQDDLVAVNVVGIERPPF